MFSFDEIVEEIEAKKKLARTGLDSWDRLLAVAKELAGLPGVHEGWFSMGKVWNLEKVAIHQYRGVANTDPLTITFDPTPGITVLHGLNGAGKSSVSDAIDLGLSGKVESSASGTAGKAPLWDPIPLTRGSSGANIEVTLVSGDARLALRAALDSDGEAQSHTATLIDMQGSKQVPLDTAWYNAVTSHQPVFAYASLERRVQLSKDLAAYFEGLLALGGSFVALQESIASRSLLSSEALKRWNAARGSAMRSISQIDRDRSDDIKITPLKSIDEPCIDDDMNEWLEGAGLLESGAQTSTLPRDSLSRLIETANEAQTSITRFEGARDTSERRLSAALKLLHSEALDHKVEDNTCPVCLAPGSGWLELLGETVKRNTELADIEQAVARNTQLLAQSVSAYLDIAIDVVGVGNENGNLNAVVSTASDLLSQFREARQSRGDTQFIVLAATSQLTAWISSGDAPLVFDEAILRADARKQWGVARTRAVAPFVDVWKADGESARDAAIWGQTAKRLEDVRKQLRSRRSVALEERASVRIERLLSDADLRLKAINVLTTKATMELVDKNDQIVELGMLSAGQRNAVLLAPLLASVDDGPFGFLVLDDPVHAFDELRIDRLATTLAEIAVTRRVIVLTHDERLKEHLVARTVDFDTRLVERSSASGEVDISDSSHFWNELLTDAHRIIDLALAEKGSTVDVTDAVRSLCRIGIDNALRLFVLRNASLSGRDTAEDVEAIDACYTTDKRLKQAETYWHGPSQDNPATRAMQKCQNYLSLWNQSIHGNPAVGDVSKDEIRSATAACKILVRAL